MFKVLSLFLSVFAFNCLAQSIGLSPAEIERLSLQASQKFDSGAVILHKEMKSVVDSQGFETYTMYVAIKLLDEEAERDYSKLSTNFNAHYIKRQLDFARVIDNDGSVKNISDDAIQVTNVGANSSSLDDIQVMRFALPAIKKGNVIELQHSSKQVRPIIDGHWFSDFYFQYIHSVEDRNWVRADPVLSSRLSIFIDKSFKPKWHIQGLAIKPHQSVDNQYNKYVLQDTDIPGLKVEANMGNFGDKLKSVSFTTLNKWQQVDSWAKQFLHEKINSDKEIKVLASRLAKGLSTEQEKIQAVFQYMQQNVRYIGAHVGRGGFIPHKSTEVLQQSYGDCKDQAVLIVSLLKEMNITAFPALISPGPSDKVESDFPRLQFSHMITYARLADQQELWLDTSGDTGAFPGIYGNLEGQTAFVLDGNGGSLKKITKQSAQHNRAEVTLAYEFKDNQLGLVASFSLFGHLDTSFRNMFKANPDKKDFLRRLLNPFVGDATFSDFSISNPEDWEQTFQITVRYEKLFEIDAKLDQFTYSDSMLSMLNTFTEFTYLTDPNEKTHDYFLTFPFQLVIHRDYPNFVKNAELAVTQTATETKGNYLSLQNLGEMDSNGVRLSTIFEMKQNEFSREQYKAFFEEYQQIKEFSSSTFLFSNLTNTTSPSEFTNAGQKEIITYIRKMLLRGEFEKALTSSSQLATQFPENGEVHYLHGLSLGFSNQFKEADSAFAKAESLGFVEDGL